MGTGAALGRTHSSAVDVAQANHLPRAARLAYLLTGTRDAAARVAGKAFVRAYGRFAGCGDPWGFDVALTRSVCELARREELRARLRGAAATARDEDRLWRALRALPLRRRMATVLVEGEGLSPSQAAEAMSCSTTTVEHLVERGLRDLEPAGTDVAGGLRRLLDDRGRSPSIAPSHSLSSRARLRRVAVASLWATVIVAGVSAIAAVSQVSTSKPADRPSIQNYDHNDGYSLLRVQGRQPPSDERIAVAQGRLGADEWALSAYMDPRSFLCMDVSVNASYRTLDCTAPAISGFHTFVTSSMPRDATFVYGDAASNIASIDFRLQPTGSKDLHMFDAQPHLHLQPETSMYIAVIPRYMVRVESRGQARAIDYRPIDGVLVGRDESGRLVQRTFVFMGEPKD